MFFSLSKKSDQRFPFSHQIGHWVLNHDAGWIQKGDSWQKGYRYDDIAHGNFCQIEIQANTLYLFHDRERSFPLWWDSEQKVLTNCLGSGQRLWSDDQVIIDRNTVHINKQNIVGDVDLSEVSFGFARANIRHNLARKFDRLKTELGCKKIFLSGGVDTLALFSFAKVHNIDFEYIDHEYFFYDHFSNQFIDQIRQQHWAYRQIHHWAQPCFFITGAYGDEYLFRGPFMIAVWTAWHGIDLLDLLDKTTGYHKHYFLLEKNADIFRRHFNNRKKLQKQYPEKHDLIRYLIDVILNDHQHWHLGQTLTWTPYKDIEILKLLLRVNVEELLGQFIDAQISQSLIDPQYLPMLSRQKNSDCRQHLGQINSS